MNNRCETTSKTKVARQTEHLQALAEKYKGHAPNAEQAERERFQAESNAMAEANPLYAAARSASTNFLVVPLEPRGVKPLVDPRAATNDARLIMAWWQEWPDANPGALLGRMGGLHALRVENEAALERLRDMAAVDMHDPDIDKRWTEYRDLGGASVWLVKREEPVRLRSRVGWGRELGKALVDMKRERPKGPQTFWLVYGYPRVVSGLDAFDYRARSVAEGLRVMGEGEVLPWNGAILEGDVQVVAPMSRPPEAPLWLAKEMGKQRSRKVMAAERMGYEAAQRAMAANVGGFAELLEVATRKAREAALAEVEKAKRELEGA